MLIRGVIYSADVTDSRRIQAHRAPFLVSAFIVSASLATGCAPVAEPQEDPQDLAAAYDWGDEVILIGVVDYPTTSIEVEASVRNAGEVPLDLGAPPERSSEGLTTSWARPEEARVLLPGRTTDLQIRWDPAGPAAIDTELVLATTPSARAARSVRVVGEYRVPSGAVSVDGASPEVEQGCSREHPFRVDATGLPLEIHAVEVLPMDANSEWLVEPIPPVLVQPSNSVDFVVRQNATGVGPSSVELALRTNSPTTPVLEVRLESVVVAREPVQTEVTVVARADVVVVTSAGCYCFQCGSASVLSETAGLPEQLALALDQRAVDWRMIGIPGDSGVPVDQSAVAGLAAGQPLVLSPAWPFGSGAQHASALFVSPGFQSGVQPVLTAMSTLMMAANAPVPRPGARLLVVVTVAGTPSTASAEVIATAQTTFSDAVLGADLWRLWAIWRAGELPGLQLDGLQALADASGGSVLDSCDPSAWLGLATEVGDIAALPTRFVEYPGLGGEVAAVSAAGQPLSDWTYLQASGVLEVQAALPIGSVVTITEIPPSDCQ